MFDYIEKLRQKPYSTKKQIAFLVSFSFVSVIFIIWVTAVYPSFGKENIDNPDVSEKFSPFSTFNSVLSQSMGAIGDQISKISGVVASLSSSTQDYIISSSTSTSTIPLDTSNASISE